MGKSIAFSELSGTSQARSSALPDAWIERLFQRMEDRYGDLWANRYGAFPRDRVKRSWGEDLADLSPDEIVRGACYPLRVDRVREADISRWIAECVTAGLIALYEVDSKPYILFHKLGPARAKESQFPAPPKAAESGRTQTQTDESRRLQTRADVP